MFMPVQMAYGVSEVGFKSGHECNINIFDGVFIHVMNMFLLMNNMRWGINQIIIQ